MGSKAFPSRTPTIASEHGNLAKLTTRRLEAWSAYSVTVDFDQALVADPEVVGDLVQDDPAHLPAKPFRVVCVEPHEWAVEDRDLVRQHPAVIAAASGEGYALIEAEQSLTGRWFVLDHRGVRKPYANAASRFAGGV